MTNYISREEAKQEIPTFAVCAGKPTLLARNRVQQVLEGLPGLDIVFCRECVYQDVCTATASLSEDGFCSAGECDAVETH